MEEAWKKPGNILKKWQNRQIFWKKIKKTGKTIQI